MTREEAKRLLEKMMPQQRGDIKSIPHLMITEAFSVAIKALEQQPCEDCISREAVLDMATTIQTDDFSGNEIIEVVDIDDIKELPPVTPKQKIGRWIDIQYFKADVTYYRPKCPFCSIEPKEYSNFCPNCGARMEGNA